MLPSSKKVRSSRYHHWRRRWPIRGLYSRRRPQRPDRPTTIGVFLQNHRWTGKRSGGALCWDVRSMRSRHRCQWRCILIRVATLHSMYTRRRQKHWRDHYTQQDLISDLIPICPSALPRRSFATPFPCCSGRPPACLRQQRHPKNVLPQPAWLRFRDRATSERAAARRVRHLGAAARGQHHLRD